MHNILYHTPSSLSEAVSLLLELKDARVLAGGTDLIAKWKKSNFFDMAIIDIRNVQALQILEETKDGLYIGAGVTMDRVSENLAILSKYSILAEAASKVGSVQIRNLATIGGNACNAAPSADMVLPLIAYDAIALIVSKNKERQVALRNFFIGPGKTILEKGEILKGFVLPNPPINASVSFIKHSRRAGMDLATVGVAMLMTVKNGSIEMLRIVLGAVGPTPIFVEGLERFSGNMLNSDLVLQIVEHGAKAASPITDVRGSKEYREAIIRKSISNCFKGYVENNGCCIR